MEITHDAEAQAAYLRLRDGHVSTTHDLGDNVLIDRDTNGHILGIEILDADPQPPRVRAAPPSARDTTDEVDKDTWDFDADDADAYTEASARRWAGALELLAR